MNVLNGVNMIPKLPIDFNSNSAYEKLKFIPEHYNEIMAAYTDIMEHLRLPVGSGGDCLHEVVEVTNPCPAYVQFDLNISNDDVGLKYTYKDNYGDYITTYMNIKNNTENSVTASIADALRKYNREYPNNTISFDYYSSATLAIFPKLTNEHSGLDYTVILLDKTTGEPVENIDENYEFDGYDEVTYDTVSEMYDIKLALTDGSYSYKPIILGDFYEKLVELRNSRDMPNYLAKLPTPEEFGRMLNVSSGYTPKVSVKLLTEEERVEVRRYIQMNTSGNVPPDTPYMYALDVFCHPSTVDDLISVKCNIGSSYSKGYINMENTFGFGRNAWGCGDGEDVTYVYCTVTLTPSNFSNSYVYFKKRSYEISKGTVVMPQTFKLIQSKEGIDRRL